LSNWTRDELDIDSVFPFIPEQGPAMLRPGALVFAPVKKEIGDGAAQWDLSNAKICAPLDDDRDDLQPGLERLNSPPLSASELSRVSGLALEQISNVTSASISIVDIEYRSIGSDVIAARARGAATKCDNSISKGTRYVVRRTAIGRVIVKLAFGSMAAAAKARKTLTGIVPQLGGVVSSDQKGAEVHIRTLLPVVIGISLRAEK
jgi:hypothetical protein